MRQVNQYNFYMLGVNIHPLSTIQEGETINQHIVRLFTAKNWLEFLLGGRVVPIAISRQSAQNLINAIDSLIEKWNPSEKSEETVLSFNEAYELRNGTQTFEAVFSAELYNLDTYFVSQKGIYSTPFLIDVADSALDPQIVQIMPEEAVLDFKQAGRCLALELPTASGYHVMRATESVLRKWHGLLVPSSRARLWGPCVTALTAAGADSNTLAVLDQIRQLHRNPLMHPEIFLSVSDSLRLFDIAKSAIIAMGEQIIAYNTAAAASLEVPATP